MMPASSSQYLESPAATEGQETGRDPVGEVEPGIRLVDGDLGYAEEWFAENGLDPFPTYASDTTEDVEGC